MLIVVFRFEICRYLSEFDSPSNFSSTDRLMRFLELLLKAFELLLFILNSVGVLPSPRRQLARNEYVFMSELRDI